MHGNVLKNLCTTYYMYFLNSVFTIGIAARRFFLLLLFHVFIFKAIKSKTYILFLSTALEGGGGGEKY